MTLDDDRLAKMAKISSPVGEGSFRFVEEGAFLATVSLRFVEDWLVSLRAKCSEKQYSAFLQQAGFTGEFFTQPHARVTHDQIVKLYQVFAIGTGDEMMGLWTRPIRAGALKYLCKIMIDAPSIRTALYRFTQYWNLLLDDYKLRMTEADGAFSIVLYPCSEQHVPHRFGHMLLLKLTHGIVSWLAGRELPVQQVAFSFARPSFAEDYPILFPSGISFGERCSSITFADSVGKLRIERSPAEMRAFLERAPRDWIFTAYKEHALQLKVREFLYTTGHIDRTLEQTAQYLNMSPRTLIRKLAAEDLSFQGIKDGLRRDIAIRDLGRTSNSLEEISYSVGFSSVAVFHRAFKHWTGMTPTAYRRQFGKA